MIRKKNKNVVETEKNQAEIKAREEELKRIQEEREQRKQKQTELTNNLKKTYSHIRPTIIQGQRILKIIENFEEKVRQLQILSSKNLQSIKPELLEIKEPVAEILESLKAREREYCCLKDEVFAKKKEFEAYVDEDEEANEQEVNVVADAEQEKIYLMIKEKEEEIGLLGEKYKKKIRGLLRMIGEDSSVNQKLANAVAGNSESPLDENILKSCHEIIVSLKFVFLKKLSTGFDEQETHKNLMERLKANITENSKLLKVKEDELQSIVEERSHSNMQKNEEITKCKNDLVEMKKQENDKSKALEEENVRKRQKTKNLHEDRENKLRDGIAKAIRDLQEQERRNSEEEGALTKGIDEAKTRLSNFIQEYDTQMRDRKVLHAETKVSLSARVRLDVG